MTFQLPPLPWNAELLQPHMSAETVAIHHGKHHQAYVDELNRAVEGTPDAELSLERLICKAADDTDQVDTFHNAAQVWNHTFFWSSISPMRVSPSGPLLEAIQDSFGSFERFQTEFVRTAASLFGSGWVWLAADYDGTLTVFGTSNAGTPIVKGPKPLLVLDVWEHAYYLDYTYRRGAFANAFIEHLANWDFASSKLASDTISPDGGLVPGVDT